MDVESALKVVGSLGRFQKFIVAVNFLCNIAYGCQMVLMVIVGATPNEDIPSERNLTTIVTEWDLQDQQWKVDLLSSLFMVSYAVGCVICGQVSDLYGRKWTFIINFTGMQISGLCSAFCKNWTTFTVSRCFTGFFAGASGHVLFALLLENIGKEYWGLVGMLHSCLFSMGVMLLSLFGFTLQNWRHVCLVTSAFPLAILPVYIFFVPESSRWLYHVGKVEKAEKVLRLIAEKNGRPGAGITLCGTNDNEFSSGEEDLRKYSIIDMLKRPKLAIYASASFYIWFACSFVYYGLTFDASMLSPNIYIANVLSGVIELPAIFITAAAIRLPWLGRKGTLIVSFSISAAASIGLIFANGLKSDNLAMTQTVLGLLNKLSVAGIFALLYVYCSEVFPTQLRLVALGGSSMFARAGAIISPFVPLLAPVASYLPYAVFGFVIVIGGAVNLILPETLNKPSPEMSDFTEKKKLRESVKDFMDDDSAVFLSDEAEKLVIG